MARDANPTQGFKATEQQLEDWPKHDVYWREHWTTRPYAMADRGYTFYEPGYRYGYEAAHRYRDRKWQWADAEDELRTGWDRYEGRGESTWENVKDAVKDAWMRVTNP